MILSVPITAGYPAFFCTPFDMDPAESSTNRKYFSFVKPPAVDGYDRKNFLCMQNPCMKTGISGIK